MINLIVQPDPPILEEGDTDNRWSGQTRFKDFHILKNNNEWCEFGKDIEEYDIDEVMNYNQRFIANYIWIHYEE